MNQKDIDNYVKEKATGMMRFANIHPTQRQDEVCRQKVAEDFIRTIVNDFLTEGGGE